MEERRRARHTTAQRQQLDQIRLDGDRGFGGLSAPGWCTTNRTAGWHYLASSGSWQYGRASQTLAMKISESDQHWMRR